MQALQRRQERKARHKELCPHRVVLVQIRAVRNLCAQDALKK
jgi:hypothetical protein